MKNFLFVLIGLIAITVFLALSHNIQKVEVDDKVKSLGGELIDDQSSTRFSDDPFSIAEHGKNITIHKFSYKKDGETHHGWASVSTTHTFWVIDGNRVN